MGHGNGPTAAADQQGCRVLPVIEEEPDEQSEGEGSPEEMTRLAERRKAIVARMRELLSRAAAAQSTHHKLRRSTVATAKKWKRAVGRIQRRGKNHQQLLPAAAALQEEEEEDGMLMSSSSSISSHSSFTWDAAAAAETCCLSPAADRSPLLWPATFISTQRAGTTADQRQASLPATGVLRLSCGSSWSEDDDDMRLAHWVTTDSDFVVLEL